MYTRNSSKHTTALAQMFGVFDWSKQVTHTHQRLSAQLLVSECIERRHFLSQGDAFTKSATIGLLTLALLKHKYGGLPQCKLQKNKNKKTKDENKT
jgi:hypothetical protein